MRSENAQAAWRVRPRSRVPTLVLGTLVLALGVSAPALAAPSRVTTLAVDPKGGVLWVGTAHGLSKSADQGRTLDPVALPTRGPTAEVTAVVVASRAPGVVYVATGGEGIFKSEDGGTRWIAASSGLGGLDVRGLAVSPTDGRLHAQVRGKGLFRSFDGARTWERVDNGPAGALQTLISVNISTGMGGIFLYAATDQGLVRGPD